MLGVLEEVTVPNDDLGAKSHIGLARALLLFQAGRIDASYQLALSLLQELRQQGVANSIAMRLQSGLGAILGRQGRYLDASIQHEQALREGALLGNDTLTTQARANLAFCYGRLGRYEDQLACAAGSPMPNPSDPVTFTDVHLACSLAFPHAALGRRAKMRDAIDETESRIGPEVDAYVSQSWYLWKADILAVAGLREEAMRVGAEAVLSHEMTLQCSALAGVYARWLAVSCARSSLHMKGAKLLVNMKCGLDDYDALDQVEILCASLHYGFEDVDGHLREIQRRIVELPDTALLSLRASGIAVGF